MLRTVSARQRAGAWPSPTTCARSAASRCLARHALREGEEETLIAGHAVDHRRFVAAERLVVRGVRGLQAGDVGDVLAQGLLAAEVQAGSAS